MVYHGNTWKIKQNLGFDAGHIQKKSPAKAGLSKQFMQKALCRFFMTAKLQQSAQHIFSQEYNNRG